MVRRKFLRNLLCSVEPMFWSTCATQADTHLTPSMSVKVGQFSVQSWHCRLTFATFVDFDSQVTSIKVT